MAFHAVFLQLRGNGPPVCTTGRAPRFPHTSAPEGPGGVPRTEEPPHGHWDSLPPTCAGASLTSAQEDLVTAHGALLLP
jgi:hypothetical protein